MGVVEFDTEVTDVIKRAPGVKSFRFKTRQGADFQAGQYFFVKINVAGIEKSKHFSFSSSPTESQHIEFTKRITSSEYSKALDGLKLGDLARLRMPYGSFTYKPEYKKIAFLSGGIGITPIRSICKFIADKKLGADIVLLYGNNKEEDIIFKADFDNMAAANKNIRAVYTLTAPDIDKSKWTGRIGYIDDKMITLEIPDYMERIFYLCGPPVMVAALTDILRNKLSLKPTSIVTENFAGY
ncbi:MAG: FAD-dependent oxidoreductase [Candidatus Omnitrophota bacterium]